MPKSNPKLHDKAWLEEQYLIKQRTYEDIGLEIGATKHGVYHAMQRFNIPSRKHTSKYAQLNDKVWLENAYKSKTISEIARITGSNPGNVHSALSTLKTPSDKSEKLEPTIEALAKLKDKAWLGRQLQEKTLRIIADDLRVSYARVQGSIKKLGIKVPERKKYLYTSETRKAKSEAVIASLNIRFPDGRAGKTAANWRGGLPHCLDCGNETARYDAIRCGRCEKENNRLGKNNANWQGGITEINKVIRASRLYKIWRKIVYERDGYTCQMEKCGKKGGTSTNITIHADHIKPFALVVNLIIPLKSPIL